MLDLLGDYIPYFRELNSTQLKLVEKITKQYSCKSGDIVYLQGEYCQNWIIVSSGKFISKKRVNDTITEENIILEGESFDFVPTIEHSVTESSLEALTESSVLVIDILGLKKLAKRNPILISLIKTQLADQEANLWENSLMRQKNLKQNYIFRKSFFWSLLKISPLTIMTIILSLFVNNFVTNSNKGYWVLALLGSSFIVTILYYLNSLLCYIELNKELIIKRQISLKKISSVNNSIPMDKVLGVKVTFKNRALKILNIGEITVDSPMDNLALNGIYNPKAVVNEIDSFRFNNVSVDKAIELSSFKYLFSKQNGLFYIENQLENDDISIFSFRKSIVIFLLKAMPPFIVFLLSSIGLHFIFNDIRIFYINIPTVLLIFWHYRDWSNDRYAFEGDKVIDIEKTPLWGKESRIVADINSIQGIKKEQKNFFEILFNFGNIEVDIMGSKIVYPSINNPDKVIDNLYLVKKYYLSKKESLDKMQRQEEFLNYTKYYQELTKQ